MIKKTKIKIAKIQFFIGLFEVLFVDIFLGERTALSAGVFIRAQKKTGFTCLLCFYCSQLQTGIVLDTSRITKTN
jgi:hypothetical protein